MRKTVGNEILKLILYVALINAGGIEQEGLVLLSLLLSVFDIFKIGGQRSRVRTESPFLIQRTCEI